MKILDWRIPITFNRFTKNRNSVYPATSGANYVDPVANNSKSIDQVFTNSKNIELASKSGENIDRVKTNSAFSKAIATIDGYSEPPSKSKNESLATAVKCGFAFLASFIVATTITSSAILALPYALMIAGTPPILQKRKREKTRAEIRELWPEILDHVISGLRSGLSLSETVVGLGYRGPQMTMPIFRTFEKELKNGVGFDQAMFGIKRGFNEPLADQVCEVLKFAKGSGSRDTSITLRTLADFIRSDLDLRNEIAAKHGWIKNSATLASVAPWVLLLILSLQPQTLRAYSSASGSIVLLAGALMTALAYLWMNRVGRIPESPRVFTQ